MKMSTIFRMKNETCMLTDVNCDFRMDKDCRECKVPLWPVDSIRASFAAQAIKRKEVKQ